MLFSNVKESSEYIEFKNDSILTRKPYISHYGCNLSKNLTTQSKDNIYKDYKYKIHNDTVTIFKFDNREDSKYKIYNNQYLENSDKNEVYVLRSDFEKFPDLAVKYNDEIYWLDSPETSNGIITKNGRNNRKLKKIMKNKTVDNTEVKVYKNYDAFSKFGYNYVFGIIEVKNKK